MSPIPSSPEKKVLMCGIQPTSTLTLGNYLGALVSFIREQYNYHSIFLIADLHAYTIPFNVQKVTLKELKNRSWELAKWAIACGVDPSHTKIVFQSDLRSEHLELFYFLLTHTKLGELKLMTQYKFLISKFKKSNQTEPALTGVLLYPVLMAADILMYDTSVLSVGEDQLQHLELCLSIRERINKAYNCLIFPNLIHPLVPITEEANNNRIMDLTDPSKKMSKSTENIKGTIFLNDSVEEIREKIWKSKTDSNNQLSLDEEAQPGIFNLINIYSQLSNISLQQALEEIKSLDYKSFKESLISILESTILSIQRKYREIDEADLKSHLHKNAVYLREKARSKLKDIYSQLS